MLPRMEEFLFPGLEPFPAIRFREKQISSVAVVESLVLVHCRSPCTVPELSANYLHLYGGKTEM